MTDTHSADDQSPRSGRTRIQVLQVPDCPLVNAVLADLKAAIEDAGVKAQIDIVVGEFPSPTLVIDGLDITTGEPPAGGPRCRLDPPTKEQVEAAIAALRDDP
jgi:hypothetical protein